MKRSSATYCAAAIVVAALLAGCGSDSPSSGGTTATSTTVRASATGSRGSSPPAAKAAPCATGDLLFEGMQQTATAGQLYLEVLVSAKSGVTCSLDGYPDVALYGASPPALPETPVHQAVNGAAPMGIAPLPMTLSVTGGDTAAFFVAVADVHSGSDRCQTADGLEYEAPGSHSWSSDASFATQSGGPGGGSSTITACGSSMTVSVFQPPILRDISG